MVDNNISGPLLRKSYGTNDARPKNSMHSCREYGLLAPEDREGGRANVRPGVRGYSYGATRGAVEEGRTETETGVETGQSVLLAHGMQEDGNEEKIPLDQSRGLNTCDHPGG